MGISLYELTENYVRLKTLLEAATEAEVNGDETAADMKQVYEDTLEGLEGSIEQKLLNIARLIREKQADAEALKAERQRIEKRQKAAERSTEWLRNFMASSMEVTGMANVKDNLVSVSYGAGRPKVEVTDIEALKGRQDVWKPFKFEEGNLNKTIIKAMLDEGQIIDGAQLVTEKVLTIR